MDDSLAEAQALRFAEDLRRLYAEERVQRRRAEEAAERLREAYSSTVLALSVALELRDYETGNHAERVADLALRLTREVDPALAAVPELEYGFLLHDVGKIGVPDAILLKPGSLTADELRAMQKHPGLGERILARVPHLGPTALQVVGGHHERWDGTGYPRGLAREGIPLPARIFAIADSFDAMTHDRPYRRARPFDEAVAEIARGAGSQFDPAIAEVFAALAPGLRRAA